MSKTSYKTKHRSPSFFQRGVAAVELGLVTLFMVTVAGVTTEFGRAISQYDTLAKSARAAARFLATHQSADATLKATYILQARYIALCGLSTCPDPTTYLVPNLTLTHIEALTSDTTPALANITSGGYGSIDVVTVTISPGSNFQFQTIMTPLFPNFNFGPISVTMPTVL
jgi:Flp pilus assembly protein TadG